MERIELVAGFYLEITKEDVVGAPSNTWRIHEPKGRPCGYFTENEKQVFVQALQKLKDK